MAKNSSPSRAPKTGAQLRDNRKSAKNDTKCVKKPFHRHPDESIVTVSVVQLECPRTLAMNWVRGTSSERPDVAA